jgi:lipopolysaccharide export system protein LptC
MTPSAHLSLDNWTPRLATSLREARRRTAVVHILRLLFTTGAVISAGLLLGPVIQNSLDLQPTRPTPTSPNVTILSPRFEGRDQNDNPYTLTAATARRRPDTPEIIDLVAPHLEYMSNSAVDAREGVFNRSEQTLDLVGDVVMTDAGGYTFRADSARALITESRVVGKTPLTGEGPIGEIRADAYEVSKDGDVIDLTGNVWSRIKAQRPRGRSASNKAGKQ